MSVDGFRLPQAFVHLCEAIQIGEAPDHWELRGNLDAFGHPCSNFGVNLFTDPAIIAEHTHDVHKIFREDGLLGHAEEARNEPGFIQDFNGVNNYVQFGTDDTGDPYCFDFGADPTEPSVIMWTSAAFYWRRLAPNFEAFRALLIEEIQSRPLGEAGGPESTPSPATLLGLHVKQYVLQENPSRRILIVVLEDECAESSPAERRAAEEQVRRELEAEGMTDEQRRRLDELWEKLRAAGPGRR